MKNFIILTDTRQQKENHIIKEFDNNNILHIRTNLPTADYMAIRYDNEFKLDYSVLIDTKKDMEEISSNLCSASHERIDREIQRAKDLGCEQFIFLIGDNKIKSIEDIINWQSKHTKVRGQVLLKVMSTMRKRYGVRFVFCQKKDMGKKIIEFLGEKDGSKKS